VDVTRIASFEEMSESLKVWKVRTQSGSVYRVGLGNLAAVLKAEREPGLEVHDPAPKLHDGRGLRQVPVSDWVGQSLCFGAVTTSTVVEVQEEADPSWSAALSRAVPPKQELPFPEKQLQQVEIAAELLRRTYQKRNLAEELHEAPSSLERMRVALTECALLIQALGRQLNS